MTRDIEKVLLSQEQIAEKVAEIGAQISRDYAGKNPMIVSVLKGSFIFMADLVRAVTIPCTVDFMSVSSYGSGTTSSGVVHVAKDLNSDIAGRNVLIVEDILDTGKTLHQLIGMLKQRNPASLKICVLLDKPARREEDIHADYVGYTIPDAFVVGYGLDYAEEYRNLPYIGVLSPSVYSHE